jgi:hypothetical protein
VADRSQNSEVAGLGDTPTCQCSLFLRSSISESSPKKLSSRWQGGIVVLDDPQLRPERKEERRIFL